MLHKKFFDCVATAKTQIIVFRLSFLDQLNNVYGSALSFWLYFFFVYYKTQSFSSLQTETEKVSQLFFKFRPNNEKEVK